MVSRSLVGAFFRNITVTPTVEQLTSLKTQADAALSQLETSIASLPSATALTQHPMQRAARLLSRLLGISVELLGTKPEEEEAKSIALLAVIPETLGEGLLQWQSNKHVPGWWGGHRLGLARRWQLEEATWSSLALQAWVKMIPRKAKNVHTALKKTHALVIEKLNEAITRTDWAVTRIATSEPSEETVAVAVEISQKTAVSALREALTLLLTALQDSKKQTH